MKNGLNLVAGIIFTLPAFADIKDDIYGENEAAKSYFESFVMDCSQRTPQCIERQAAAEEEERFNQIFIVALDRDMQDWPNDELSKLRAALQTRKDGDLDFGDGFFGNASELYESAYSQISKLIIQADTIVNENIEIGEEYLYEENRADWAAEYFNEALVYDPTNPRISKALSRIRFLQSFEEDIDIINGMLDMQFFDDALDLINELILGDPGNVTLLELKKQASEGEIGIKINETLQSFQDELLITETQAQKIELLSKISNSLSVYGNNAMTQAIQDLKISIEDDLFTQRFEQLQDNFINNSTSIDELYKEAETLLTQYPNKQDVLNLSRQIQQKRNAARLQSLKDSASKLAIEENWDEAIRVSSEIYLITDEEADKQALDNLKTLKKRLSSLAQITSEPSKSLNTQEKIDSAQWLLKELKKYSNPDTNQLNESIIDFESLIDTYQFLVTEELKRKKANKKTDTKVSSNNNKTSQKDNIQKNSNTTQKSTNQKNSNTKPSQQSKAGSSSSSSSSSAKLDMSSFASNISCAKRTRNKALSAQFEITVLSSGRASNVILLNASELKISTRDKMAIDEVTDALRRAKYSPAKSGDVFISSTITKKLNIPKNFCS